MPRTPLFYYSPNGNSTSPTVSLQNAARGIWISFLASAGLILKQLSDNSVQNNALNRHEFFVYVLQNAANCIRASLDFQKFEPLPENYF